jgi:hypothetical protein
MTVVLAQQNRNAGTYQGTLGQAGVSIAPAATTISASLVMAQADVENAANSVTLTVEGDWGAGWEPVAGPNAWTGGTGGVKPGQTPSPPGFLYSTTSRPMPNDLRATVVTNRRWSWGVDVTTS